MPIPFPSPTIAIKILLFIMEAASFADENPYFSFLKLNAI
ncbi:MAG: hypothetical protein ACJAUH_000257 [Saprospiraceae bacterium]|jgi:hypothetical protein